MELRRRQVATVVLGAATSVSLGTQSHAQDDPLASWNEGPAKDAIRRFVDVTTDPSGPAFVPPAERIAVFDQDGKLWVEHPVYSQVVYCLDRVPAVVQAKPELAQVKPFRTVLSGDREAIAKLSKDDLIRIAAATLTGMNVDAFEHEAKKWLGTARDPRWKRPYTELTYLPMIEVIGFCAATASGPILSQAAARILCAFMPSRCTASRRNRSSALPEARSTAMTGTAAPSSPRNQSCC
jgi:hypothetical protein